MVQVNSPNNHKPNNTNKKNQNWILHLHLCFEHVECTWPMRHAPSTVTDDESKGRACRPLYDFHTQSTYNSHRDMSTIGSIRAARAMAATTFPCHLWCSSIENNNNNKSLFENRKQNQRERRTVKSLKQQEITLSVSLSLSTLSCGWLSALQHSKKNEPRFQFIEVVESIFIFNFLSLSHEEFGNNENSRNGDSFAWWNGLSMCWIFCQGCW